MLVGCVAAVKEAVVPELKPEVSFSVLGAGELAQAQCNRAPGLGAPGTGNPLGHGPPRTGSP